MCCEDLEQALRDEIIIIMDKSYLEDGRIMNMVESPFYFRSERGNSGYDYYGINCCPFCGMAISIVAQGFSV
ncbi:MAG TPA: hypothetical protein VI935_07685 [Thermodesulfobacteriota bacterium]|nr:hypothetical protein [Thermodesulfobacteriota bacterium]